MKEPPTPLLRCNLHDWASLRSELLFLFDHAVPSDSLDVSGSREGEFSAWLVRKGKVRVQADGESAEAGPGEWLICFGREIHQKITPGTHLLSLRMLHGWPGGTPFFSQSPLQVFPASEHPRLEQLAVSLKKAVGKIQWDAGIDPRVSFLWQSKLDYLTWLGYKATLLAWLGELTKAMLAKGRTIQAPDAADPRLLKALQVLDSLHPGSLFPKSALEKAAGLTMGRLNRLSAQTYGFTLRGYWEQRRIERAKLTLEQPGQSIKEAASDLGFAQLSHFSAWFKQKTGQSPRAFRQKQLE